MPGRVCHAPGARRRVESGGRRSQDTASATDPRQLGAGRSVGVRRAPPAGVDRSGIRLDGAQGGGERLHGDVGTDGRLDPRVDGGGLHDEVARDRPGRVDVLAAPPPPQGLVHDAVVLDPRAHHGLGPGVERLSRRDEVRPLRGAAGVGVGLEESEQLVDLEHRRGETAAEVRCGRADRVAQEDEAGEGERAVGSALAAVGVEHRAAGQDRRDRVRAGGIGPVAQSRDGAGGRLEPALEAQVDEVLAVTGPHQEHREDAALVREDEALVPVEVALPRQRVQERSRAGSRVQLVLPVDVGDPAHAAGRLRGPQATAHPSRPPGRLDDEVGVEGSPVDDHPAGAGHGPGSVHPHRVHVAAPEVDAGGLLDLGPQGGLERAAPAAQAGGQRRPARQRDRHRLGARGQQSRHGSRDLALHRVHDLRPDGVRVVELHDALARPDAVVGRAGVPVDEGHRGPTPCQPGAERQPRRASPDDGHPHPTTVTGRSRAGQAFTGGGPSGCAGRRRRRWTRT